jgi:squalene-hopene/tetraprenyl-beta-curcumene cyclase
MRWYAAAITALALSVVQTASAQQMLGPSQQTYEKTVTAAVQFLASQKNDQGALSTRVGIGPTALATLGAIRAGRPINDPSIAKSLEFITSQAQPDGGIYPQGSRLPNYETCIAVVCLSEANKNGQYDELLKKAEGFLRGVLIDEVDGKQPTDIAFGGAGYGGRSQPDLSNTAFLMEALHEAGVAADDPAMQKALIFVSRCQNLESEHNTTPYAAKINDGGFYYTPIVQEQEAIREAEEGGLRSYGGMTYSGFKSLVYAGLTKDDPRLAAALEWIQKNYAVDTNPGMGDAGLFYYYHVFAKALDAAGIDYITDAAGVKHDWRKELAEVLAQRQKTDGSWVNDNGRWMEGDPNLSTAFALLALTYCQPQAAE